jgi:Ca-activated chloride channel family protein
VSGGLSWGAGGWLYLLWLVPLLVALLALASRRRRRDLDRLFGAELARRLVPPGLEQLRAWRSTLAVLGVALVALSVAQPRWGFTWRELEKRGVDIVLALDLSRSMDAEDVDPSRLGRAQRDLQDLIDELRGDRLGLVIFAGGAYPRVPLTVDYEALLHIADSCETGTLRAQGSSLASALEVSLDLLEDQERPSDRAVVLISDGESWDERVDDQLKRAQDAGIRVYTLGVGTEQGAPVPLAKGGFKSWEGEMVVSRLEEDTLKRIARETGGAYVRSVGGASDTRGLASEMRGALTERSTEVHREKVWDERFQWPLAGGLGLLFIAGLIGDGRKRAAQAASTGAVLALLLLPVPARAQDLESALELIEADRHAEAAAQLEQMRVERPEDPQVLTALAEALARSGRHEQAAEAYEELARRSEDELLQTRALYNAGHQRYQQGELDQAVGDWQQVLEREPEHPAARHNAEEVSREIQRRQAQSQARQEPQEGQDQQGGGGEQSQPSQGGSDSGEPSSPERGQDTGGAEDQQGEAGERGEPGEDEPEEASGGAAPEDSDGTRGERDLEGQEAQPGEGEPPDLLGEEGRGASPYGAEEMSEEEARKLLNGVEEGDPRVVVRGQSRTRDW